MRASLQSLRTAAAGLATVALCALAACTGSDEDASALQLDPQRAQLTLPGGDAGGADALASDAHGGADAAGSDAYGAGDDAYGAGDDAYGAGDDAYGAGDDAYGAGDGANPADDTWAAAGDGESNTDISVDGSAGSGDAGGSDDTGGGTGATDVAAADGATSGTDSGSTGGGDTATAPSDTATATDSGQNLPPGLQVEWCRLIYPAVIQGELGESADVFAHVSVPGQTDQTAVDPDPAPWLVAQVGWGPIGAVPGHDPTRFTWVSAAPDPDPPSNLFWRHDRYVAPLAIGVPGSWDFVARFSGDYGATWLYCDLDGSQNGYLAGEAGRATIAE